MDVVDVIAMTFELVSGQPVCCLVSVSSTVHVACTWNIVMYTQTELHVVTDNSHISTYMQRVTCHMCHDHMHAESTSIHAHV